MWKSLKEEDKKPFIQLAEQDKKRNEKEKLDLKKLGYFIDSDGVKSTDLMLSNPKFKKHVVLPKNVKRPQIFFFQQHYETIKKKFPDLKLTEIMKKVYELWS